MFLQRSLILCVDLLSQFLGVTGALFLAVMCVNVGFLKAAR